MENTLLAGLLSRSASLHNHLCPRQVLGVRMGLLAGELLGLDLPQTDKRLFTFMETDGCTMDGVSVATGCWAGRRTLRILDYGKVAATFVDTQSGSAFRIHPHPEARLAWLRYAPQAPDPWHGYLAAYQVMPAEELLAVQPVQLSVSLEAILSRPEARAKCERCCEEIINERQVLRDGQVLCLSCAGEGYYTAKDPLPTDMPVQENPGEANHVERNSTPVLSVIGRSGVGKTTILEKLIAELKRRGYRVGTIKHHAHPGFEIDYPGKDTWRHAQAGSDHVVIAAPDRMASIRNLSREPAIEEITAGMVDVDIILTDGYRQANLPKIEVVRAARSQQPLCDPKDLFAVIADCDLNLALPCFSLEDTSRLVDLIESRFLKLKKMGAF